VCTGDEFVSSINDVKVWSWPTAAAELNTIPPLMREKQHGNGITINKQAFIQFITKLISLLLCFWLATFPEFESRPNFWDSNRKSQ
jgi:hypothetical protein